jgi:hypothetical protein
MSGELLASVELGDEAKAFMVSRLYTEAVEAPLAAVLGAILTLPAHESAQFARLTGHREALQSVKHALESIIFDGEQAGAALQGVTPAEPPSRIC